MIRWNRVKALAAAAAMAVAVSFSAASLSALAATGTVKGDSVNVRSDASTSSSIVGTANNGDSFDLGESKDDDTGATWYQVTLSDGSTGYIRSDFLDVTDDDAAAGDASTEGTSEAATADDTSAAAASTDTTSTDTGDYQIVLAPDENGNNTYYLYNNAAQERMKLSDIESLQQQVTQAQAQVSSVRSQYRVILIVLAILLVVAIIAAIALFLRLRDALSSGRSHERDLTQERKDLRRSGNTRADDVNSLRRPQQARPQNPAARRNEPYPSGTRRVGDNGAAAGRNVRPAAGTRPQEGGAARTQAAPNTRESGQGQPVRRPQNPEQAARRPEAASRRPESAAAAARRPVQGGPAAGAQQARPAGNPSAQAQQPARKPQPKNFADDDDLDYDFISLDDGPKK